MAAVGDVSVSRPTLSAKEQRELELHTRLKLCLCNGLFIAAMVVVVAIVTAAGIQTNGFDRDIVDSSLIALQQLPALMTAQEKRPGELLYHFPPPSSSAFDNPGSVPSSLSVPVSPLSATPGPAPALATLMAEMEKAVDFHGEGLRPHFPVVFVPGIVSTGLEIWKGHSCAKKNFRQRFWGSTLMLKTILLDPACWIEHLMLNYTSGVDPTGIALRPAFGLEAADYLIGGFWVWGKMIENLADLGYTSNNMFMASYDWRLSYHDLERRDSFFTKLKSTLELSKRTNHNRKSVVVAHSLGTMVFYYFMKWVESANGGVKDGHGRKQPAALSVSASLRSFTVLCVISNFEPFGSVPPSNLSPLPCFLFIRSDGGPTWINDHIESFVNIGGPLLGVPKAVSALLSGEMKDTADMSPLLHYVKDRIFSRDDILKLFRSFGSVASMLPKGGEKIWGDLNFAPDEPELPRLHKPGRDDVTEFQLHSYGKLVAFTSAADNQQGAHRDARTGMVVPPAPPRASDGLAGAGAETVAPSQLVGDQPGAPGGQLFDLSDEIDQARAKSLDALLESQHIPLPQPVDDTDKCENSAVHCPRYDIEPPVPQEVATAFSKVSHNISSYLTVLRSVAPQFMRRIDASYDFGLEHDTVRVKQNSEEGPRSWGNPLSAALPVAPQMKIYCLYGVGKMTERAYHYSINPHYIQNVSCTHIPFLINTTQSHPEYNLTHGVQLTDGDGTVPLLSLGYMCVNGWKDPVYNPGGTTVITREYINAGPKIRPTFDTVSVDNLFRGGGTSGDHVDIMGNHELIADVLRVVSRRTTPDEPQEDGLSQDQDWRRGAGAHGGPLPGPEGRSVGIASRGETGRDKVATIRQTPVMQRIFSRIQHISDKILLE